MSPSIDQLLTIACSKGASDRIKAGSFPLCASTASFNRWSRRSDWRVNSLNMAFSIMNNRQKQRFNENSEIDIAYGVSGDRSFPLQYFPTTRNRRHGVASHSNNRAHHRRAAPAAGNRRSPMRIAAWYWSPAQPVPGKSTTLAAMIDYMNRTRTGHIVTIEDPIEFLHRDKKSYVNQREVDVDTEASLRRCEGRFDKIPTLFWSAKCATMRLLKPQSQRPRPGIWSCLLHTLDATETLNRIVSVFPPHQQRAIRLQLASVLKAVVSMSWCARPRRSRAASPQSKS